MDGTPHIGVAKFDGTKWTTYTFRNGLADNTVTEIVTDTQGNVWFCTKSGVSKFDGTHWTSYVNHLTKTTKKDGIMNL